MVIVPYSDPIKRREMKKSSHRKWAANYRAKHGHAYQNRQRYLTPESAAAFRARRDEYFKRRRVEVRAEAIKVLGGRCRCCGEQRVEFLEIDHIYGGGNQERKTKELRAYVKYHEHVIEMGWRKFRLLCSNCNHSIGAFGYCPHEREREQEWLRKLNEIANSPYRSIVPTVKKWTDVDGQDVTILRVRTPAGTFTGGERTFLYARS